MSPSNTQNNDTGTQGIPQATELLALVQEYHNNTTSLQNVISHLRALINNLSNNVGVNTAANYTSGSLPATLPEHDGTLMWKIVGVNEKMSEFDSKK